MKLVLLNAAVRQLTCAGESACRGHDSLAEMLRARRIENFEGLVCAGISERHSDACEFGMIANKEWPDFEMGRPGIMFNRAPAPCKIHCRLPDFSGLEDMQDRRQFIDSACADLASRGVSPDNSVLLFLGLDSRIAKVGVIPLLDELSANGIPAFFATFDMKNIGNAKVDWNVWRQFCAQFDQIGSRIVESRDRSEALRSFELVRPVGRVTMDIRTGDVRIDGLAALLRLIWPKCLNPAAYSRAAAAMMEEWNILRPVFESPDSHEIPPEPLKTILTGLAPAPSEIWRIWRTDFAALERRDILGLAYARFPFNALLALHEKYRAGLIDTARTAVPARILSNLGAGSNAFWMTRHFDWDDPLRDPAAWTRWQNSIQPAPADQAVIESIHAWSRASGGHAVTDLPSNSGAEGLQKCAYCGRSSPVEIAAIEETIAAKLRAPASVGDLPGWPAAIQPLAEEYKNAEGSTDLAEAVARLLTSDTIILTGGPGTGKTTLLGRICRAAQSTGVRILALAPTGRAAVRLTKKLDDAECVNLRAQTFHQALKITSPVLPPQGWSAMRPDARGLSTDLLVIDETSMVDDAMLCEALRRVSFRRLILCGDPNQLPPVQGLGEPLTHLCVGGFRAAELRECRRSSARGILRQARRILDGHVPESDDGVDVRICLDNADILKQVNSWFCGQLRTIAGPPLKSAQMLVPRHHGPLGRSELNRRAQDEALKCGRTSGAAESQHGWRPNDKILIMKNTQTYNPPPNADSRVYNGEVGWYLGRNRFQIDRESDQPVYMLPFDEYYSVALGYAITIHKSQGSEWPEVAIALPEGSADDFLDRRLLYTAVTRARTRVTLFATERSLAQAVATPSAIRDSCLACGLPSAHRLSLPVERMGKSEK